MSIQNNFPAIKPSLNLDFANTKQLDPRITFARASTARFYDGKTTAKAEENLLTFSQEFDNAAWGKLNAMVTANAEIAPNGTTTADTLVVTDTANVRKYAQQTVTASGATVFSVFVKAGTHGIIQLSQTADAQTFVNFNVSTGVVGTAGTKTTGAIVDAGNGWYRCIASFDSSTVYSGGAFRVALQGAITDGFGATTTAIGTVYVWGAQLEQRSFATAYTPTTSQPITNYIPVLQTAAAGTPRFDHNPTTGESLGLLIEEQRTNLFTYSEQFDNAAWNKTAASVTANTTAAPDGTLTADTLVDDLTFNQHLIQRADITTSAGTYTSTIYAKYNGRHISLYNLGTTNAFAVFNLLTGVVTTGGAGLVSASATLVGNGWYRCTLVCTTTAGTISNRIYLSQDGTTPAPSYTGNGFSGAFIWGAQLEAGAFATSYIPTVASQVTRAADSASITGSNFSSWYNPNEGTLFGESSFISAFPNTVLGTLSDNPALNAILLDQSGGGMRLFIRSGGTNNVSLTTPNILTSSVKFVGAYKTDDAIVAGNGGLSSADTSVVVPFVSRLDIGKNTIGNNTANFTLKRLTYYPIRCTNTQLQALTS
jgi:hypothetical protein